MFTLGHPYSLSFLLFFVSFFVSHMMWPCVFHLYCSIAVETCHCINMSLYKNTFH